MGYRNVHKIDIIDKELAVDSKLDRLTFYECENLPGKVLSDKPINPKDVEKLKEISYKICKFNKPDKTFEYYGIKENDIELFQILQGITSNILKNREQKADGEGFKRGIHQGICLGIQSVKKLPLWRRILNRY